LASFFELEQASVYGAIGDVSEKSILDLACGEGRYSRILKKRRSKKGNWS